MLTLYCLHLLNRNELTIYYVLRSSENIEIIACIYAPAMNKIYYYIILLSTLYS